MFTQLHTVLPASDLERARAFYRDAFGVEPDATYDGSLIYNAFGGTFELYETANAGTAQNTQIGFISDDLDTDMADLRSHGVVFEEYDFPGMKTENGVLTTDDGRAAWLRDSEGNFVCLSQRA